MRQLFILFVLMGSILIAEDKRFVIVAASYNNAQWYQKHLVSIFNQDYDNWRLIYIDDCSTDGTGYLVNDFIIQHNMQKKVMLDCNVERVGHLANQYQAVHSCQNNEIVVVLDGDDWLAHNGVLSYLNEVYQDDDVWLTYGSYEAASPPYPQYCAEIPDKVIEDNSIRKHTWVLSHLRTFYAGLYKKIDLNDLCLDGTFFPIVVDLAIMYPMFEMAAGRYKYISQVLVTYNNLNDLNFSKSKSINRLRKRCLSKIRGTKPYAPLSKQFFQSFIMEQKA
ncbi:MAG: glycosyltransferase family 2 protein [Candidatus Dependentiae bacterium]